jgi:hypothetical protein
MQVKSSANVTERRRVIIKKCKAFYFTLFQPFLQVNLCKAKMFTSPVYFSLPIYFGAQRNRLAKLENDSSKTSKSRICYGFSLICNHL